MDTEKYFSGLAKKASKETPPHVDVVFQVMARLRSDYAQANRQYEKPLMWIAGLSTAAAVSLASFALLTYYFFSEPLNEISQTISWVM